MNMHAPPRRRFTAGCHGVQRESFVESTTTTPGHHLKELMSLNCETMTKYNDFWKG